MKRRDILISILFATTILSCSGSSDAPLESTAQTQAANIETMEEGDAHNGSMANGFRRFGAGKTTGMQPLDPDLSYQFIVKDNDNYLYEFNVKESNRGTTGLIGRMRYKCQFEVYETDAIASFSKENKSILIRTTDPFYHMGFSLSCQLDDDATGQAMLLYDGLKIFCSMPVTVMQNNL